MERIRGLGGTPEKGLKVLEVFREFEKLFGRLSTRDQAMFLRAMDVRDQHDLGILLDNVTLESGLKDEWDDVRNNMA